MNGSRRDPKDKATPSDRDMDSWTHDVMIVDHRGRAIGRPTIIVEHGRHDRLVRGFTVIPPRTT